MSNEIIIRPMEKSDQDIVVGMMKVFYASDAVSTNGSEKIFRADILECISGSPYAEGYVFDDGGKICGYGMLAKSFSTEFGKRCIWIEDLYLSEEYRGRGLAGQFFAMVEEKYTDCILRLEAEHENTHAMHVYLKRGFDELPYAELKKII